MIYDAILKYMRYLNSLNAEVDTEQNFYIMMATLVFNELVMIEKINRGFHFHKNEHREF